MKIYTITATCTLMPVAYIARDEVDYYFTTNASHASTFNEDEIDSEIDDYIEYHPEYTFTKREVVSK